MGTRLPLLLVQPTIDACAETHTHVLEWTKHATTIPITGRSRTARGRQISTSYADIYRCVLPTWAVHMYVVAVAEGGQPQVTWIEDPAQRKLRRYKLALPPPNAGASIELAEEKTTREAPIPPLCCFGGEDVHTSCVSKVSCRYLDLALVPGARSWVSISLGFQREKRQGSAVEADGGRAYLGPALPGSSSSASPPAVPNLKQTGNHLAVRKVWKRKRETSCSRLENMGDRAMCLRHLFNHCSPPATEDLGCLYYTAASP